MRSVHRLRSLGVRASLLVLLLGVPAGAESRKRPRLATHAEVERIDRELAEQRKRVDALVALHKQQLQALIALFPDAKAAAGGDAPAPVPISQPEPEPAKQPAPATPPKPTARPRATPRVEAAVGAVSGVVTGADDAVVYIDTIVASAKGSATMRQEGKQFVPQVLVVQQGTTVQFPNRDAVFHNVFSVTPDHSFDLGIYQRGESKSVAMLKPGVVRVHCNMHSQMVGHILVVPNGDFVRPDKSGAFRIDRVPVGRHRVVAWAPNAKPVTQTIEVARDGAATVSLALVKRRAALHTKKDGMPYGSYDK